MRWIGAMAVLGGAVAGAAVSLPAAACGGFFCSANAPVNQTAERIIFAQDGDRVDAVIEVQYEGPAESFAWVLPVPSGEAVDVGVSSMQLLDALQSQSNPQYDLIFVDGPNCRASWMSDPGLLGGVLIADEGASGGPGAVEVVVAGTVGPYDYVQLAVDENDANPASSALEWLSENEYDVSSLGEELLGEYLDAGLDLIAFRLGKDNDAGSIRPVRLSWRADYPVIPIRPTAVAATENMGILVWVLGKTRAVPTNYLHLELNEAKINWFNASSNYDDVVTEAADEAGGQGFVTEQSTDASDFSGSLVSQATFDDFDALKASPPAPEQALRRALELGNVFGANFPFQAYDGLMELLGDPLVVPLRAGETAESLVECVDCYFETPGYDPERDPLQTMDVELFLTRLDEDVFLPLRETVALFDAHDVVTRLYTTLSPNEMTVDPAFDFNPDLGPVSNVHTAEVQVQCDGEQVVTLESGAVVVTTNSWDGLPNDLPANLRILQLSTRGAGDVVQDNTEQIRAALPPPKRPQTGCAVHAPSAPSFAWRLTWPFASLSACALALLSWRSRRRRH